MLPGQPGAIKLQRRHGDALVCVRYRLSEDGGERLTTIELVVERTAVEKRRDEVVAFKLHGWETQLQQLARSKGGRYDPRTRMWRMSRREVLRLGLRSRIATEDDAGL